jgi:excinuclease ABC subunit C
VPPKPGVYLMRNSSGKIIYVGKAKNLRRRLRDYFCNGAKDQKVEAMLREVSDFEIHLTSSERSALLLEEKMILDFLPSFNIMGRSPRRRYWIVAGGSPTVPRLEIRPTSPRAPEKNYGIYPSLASAGWIVAFLNRLYGLRSCLPAIPTDRDFAHCLEHRVNNCSAPCVDELGKPSYLENFSRACTWLEQPRTKIIGLLEEHMKTLARRHKYEQAARCRDVLHSLGDFRPASRSTRRRRLVRPSLATEQLRCLQEALGLSHPPRKMEAFDISHMGGTTNIASVVVFADGQPCTKDYRHFRLPVLGANDVECIKQAVIRRYTNAELPDLVLIDGGLPQLGAARSAFDFLKKTASCLVALAKERETIFLSSGAPLQLDLSSPALHLVQRIRDEAHRIANSATRRLSSRKMRASSLLGVRGVGPHRAKLLLKEYGTVKKIAKSSPEALSKLLRISPSRSSEILRELRAHSRTHYH